MGGPAEAAIGAQSVLYVGFDCRFDSRLRLFLVYLNNRHFNLLFDFICGTAGSDLRSRSRTRRIGRGVGSRPAVPVLQSCLVRVPSCWKSPLSLVLYAGLSCAGSWADSWAVSVAGDDVSRTTAGTARNVSNCCPGSESVDCLFVSGSFPVACQVWNCVS